MQNNTVKELKKYTYADLLEIDDDNRYEIIDGNLYLMSSPRTKHQAIAGEIHTQLAVFLRGKKCTPFISPLDVVLSKSRQHNKILNVVQPDVFVVCDTNKIDETMIFGAPDFIIEILSPSSIRHDQLDKLNLYQKYKVKEYWIIDPVEMTVLPFLLNEQGTFELEKVYDLKEEIPVRILKGCTIRLKQFIEENINWLDTKKNTKLIEN